MDRRAFLTGASAAALSIALPSAALARPSYLNGLVERWGCDGMGPIIPSVTTRAQMGAWFARYRELSRHGPGMLSLHPEGMTDWHQSTPAEIVDDIRRALNQNKYETVWLEEPL